MSRLATSPKMRASRQPWRHARCLCLHLGRRRHAHKFAMNIGSGVAAVPEPQPICCWGSVVFTLAAACLRRVASR